MDFLKVNSFKVVGRLVAADAKTGFDKAGRSYISVAAQVQSEIGGKTNIFDISFYSQEMTKENKVSQLYTSYSKLPELVNKKVEISGEIRENRYWSNNLGQLVSAQLLTGRFVKGVLENVADEAHYEIGGFIVKTLTERKNKAGEIYRYDFSIGQGNYNDTNMSVYTLHVNPNQHEIIRGVQGYNAGDTVVVKGDLNFTQEKVTVTDEHSSFGEPMVRTYTNSQKNFYVTGGSNPYTSEQAYTHEAITNLVDAYKANDVNLMNSASANSTPAQQAPAAESKPVTRRQTNLI